jgi:formylglycine-generating enzyme required for sulfatase activity
MTREEATERLRAFERDHGRDLVGLASHAAMPVVLNSDALHLLRINYFLDPPHALPYTGESSLLLSSLCTEIDDGLYVIDPELRDLLLRRLVEEYGGVRVRDVARLLWEYSERGAPWEGRPGLTEAQQLSALNFIDPPLALGWLARARRGEGALPVDDDRWFVALERDLMDRAAAVEEAEGEAVFLAGKLPALTELGDALIKLYEDPRAALIVALQLGLTLPGMSEQMGPSRLWHAALGEAWLANRMPELLQTVSKDLGDAQSWTRAIREYWFRLSPALRVEQGRFEAPPPEWQILEQQRPHLEDAIRALVLIAVEDPSRKPRVLGMGTLVGDYVVLTHRSNLGESFMEGGGLKSGYRLFAEFSEDHPFLAEQELPGLRRRLELTSASIEDHTGLAVLTSDPDADRTGLPRPLRVIADPPPVLKGRKICVMGYPGKDSRNDPAVLSRVMGNTYGVLRLQPGEILDEDPVKALISHNCFTAGGNGGSSVIDVQMGQVLGVHFAARYEPGPSGFKRGQAISTFRLGNHPLLVDAGVFRTSDSMRTGTSDSPARRHRPRDEIFVNRVAEQQLFLSMLRDRRGHVLFVEGRGGSGKTALLRQLANMAEEHNILAVFLDASQLEPTEHFLSYLGRQLGLDLRTARDATKDAWFTRVVSDALVDRPTVLLFDNVDQNGEALVSRMAQLVLQIQSQLAVLVVAGRDLGPIKKIYDSKYTRVVELGSFDREALRAWLEAEDIDFKEEVLDILSNASGGWPGELGVLIAYLRDTFGKSPEERRAASSWDPERLPTVEVIRPTTSAVVFYDDPSERHGPYVLTRGTHTILVPERFRICAFPVTNELFGEFVRAGGYRQEEFWQAVPSWARSGFTCGDGTPGPSTWTSASTPFESPKHPVAGISYHEALAFVTWLDRTIAAPENMQWCLPTENMWEFAARGPTGLIYPWGPTFEEERCNSREANIGTTSAIGRFPGGRSAFGADDMAGNVWEFVRAADSTRRNCVLRGGSFTNTREEIKASLRLVRVPRDHRPPDFGLRCGLEPK